MPYLAFNDEWFSRHQGKLLYLLNHRFTRRWFRWVLRIRQTDCPLSTTITEIGPNRFSYGDRLFFDKQWKIERTTNFRTHQKYSKRLYLAFRPLWWTLHFWDWLVADRLIPRWSFGFLTLTAFPTAGTGGPTGDAMVSRQVASETFSTIRSGAGTNTDNSGTALSVIIQASSTSNQFSEIARAVITFDTSSLTSSASISSAVLSGFGEFNGGGLSGDNDWYIAGSTPATNFNFAASDYAQCQTTSFGKITNASFSTTAYNDVTLNASGVSNISKTGISKFSLQLGADLNNTAPTWSSGAFMELDVSSADHTGTSQDPKLVVTYTLAATLLWQPQTERPIFEKLGVVSY